MTHSDRIAVLQEQHRKLDAQIKLMEQTKGDAADIVHLKKKKLEIKDEISRLTRLQFEEQQRINWDDE